MKRFATWTLAMMLLAGVTGRTAWTQGGRGAPSGAPPAPAGKGMHRLPETPAPEPAAAPNPAVQQLDEKLKALRTEFHSQLDPLQAQVKALREKYEPQIKDLETQRKELVEQSKPPEIQKLDREEDEELTALADKEKDEIEKLKARFTEERKEIQQKYDQRRREVSGAKR